MTGRVRATTAIAAFTATGRIPQLREALATGLDEGLTISEIKEVLIQLYAYAGFPRSLNGLGALMEVVAERRTEGIEDPPGAEPAPLPSGTDLLSLGAANQTKLVGAPVTGPLFEFAPAIDQFLKAHLFGDIFARDNLDWPTREIATVAALSALDGLESQLRSHVAIARNVGVTDTDLRSVAATLRARVGEAPADRLDQVLAS
ncbi:carboxymuconolactone decarboxylase family protein [Actinoplanes sp. NPDC000266]